MAIFIFEYATNDQVAPDLFVPNGKSWRIMSVSANDGFPLRLEYTAPEAQGGGSIFAMPIGRIGDSQAVAAIGAAPSVDDGVPSSTYTLPDIPLPANSNVQVSMRLGTGSTTLRLLIAESANVL